MKNLVEHLRCSHNDLCTVVSNDGTPPVFGTAVRFH